VGRNRELVWLRATRSQHVGVTRITHQAAIRLGLTQSVTEAYQVRLKLSGEPLFVLPAEEVKTLECVRSKNERKDTRVLQPDVIIGWSDWNKVQPFAMSGWAIPGQMLPGATAPACHQVALEDEPKRQSSGIPQRGVGPGEEVVHHHPQSHGEDGGAV
jgi:hypothetical protein